jgi:hypothetical protein
MASVLALLASNVIALGIAWTLKMSLRDLMLVYWIQSVVIGAASFMRILRLERFDVAGFRMNGRPVEETPATRRQVAAFFAMHYGIFHVVYFAFIVGTGAGKLGSLAGYLACALVFVVNHGYSLRRNLARDSQGRPNIGTLMFLPYARILPMHLTILAGGAFFGGTFAFFLFGFLKTLADVVMHVVEHYVLGARPPASSS